MKDHRKLKDDYFEKILRKSDRDAESPRISLTDVALLGTIFLFLVLAGGFWLFNPGELRYSNLKKEPPKRRNRSRIEYEF